MSKTCKTNYILPRLHFVFGAIISILTQETKLLNISVVACITKFLQFTQICVSTSSESSQRGWGRLFSLIINRNTIKPEHPGTEMSSSWEGSNKEKKLRTRPPSSHPRLDSVVKSLWGLYQRYPAIKISQIKAA